MNDARAQRHRTLTHLLRTEALSSQEEVQERLRRQGVEVTQATVSRDLDLLGAVKLRRSGRTIYALPEELDRRAGSPSRLDTIAREWVASAEAVGNLVVVRTPPGSAHLVGVAVDEARLAGVAGTICGDDTLLIAAREPSAATMLAEELTKGVSLNRNG